jgi:hypothetical protein
LTGWWFVRNYQLYGEWLATDTHLNLAGRAPLTAGQVWELRAEAERAYWATFGWGQIRPPEGVYRLLFWLTRLGLVGLVLAMLGRLIQGTKRKPLPFDLSLINFEQIIILLLWVGFNLLLYLRWVMEVGSVSHTRLVFPAISAISLLLAVGWHAMLPRRICPAFTALVATAFLALNLYSLGWLIYPAFKPGPVQAHSLELKAAPQTVEPTPVKLTFLDSLNLLAVRVYPLTTPTPATKHELAVSQGEVIMARATWQVQARMDQNYSLAIALLAPDGSVLAQRETYPGLGLHPTRYLNPGQRFTDLYPLKLAADVPEPIVAGITINPFDYNSPDRAGFPALDAGGREVTPLVGQIKIVPTSWPVYRPAKEVRVNFAGRIALTGYDRQEEEITLYWESLAPVSEDYVVFVHLIDSAGQVILQADGSPTGNFYPTSWWAPGEIIADRRTLPAAGKAVKLRLGLYDLKSGQRLAITESTLPTQENGAELTLNE